MKYKDLVKTQEALVNCDLSFQQLMALLAIHENPSIRASALAQVIGSTSANASGFINRFLSRGLIKAENPEGDRRVVELTVTVKGKKLVEKFNNGFENKKNGKEKAQVENKAVETPAETAV